MTDGIMWAVLAGLMLGLYALPEKFTKGFRFENTWGLFFVLTMFVVPIIATFTLISGLSDIYARLPASTLVIMVVASSLWSAGVVMWGMAISHIGMSLGYSLFVGTTILIGSILPICIDVMEKGVGKGLPSPPVLAVLLAGVAVVLFGIFSNGRAGLQREKDEAAGALGRDTEGSVKKTSMALGIFIAVFGGLLASGFSVANRVGGKLLGEASTAAGNPPWMAALAVMFPIFLSGGVVTVLYFAWQLTRKRAWGGFQSPYFMRNLALVFVMAFLHYAASAVFAYAALQIGDLGPSIGWAIYTTSCVVVAVVSGIVTGEWALASFKARRWRDVALASLALGIGAIAGGNYLDRSSLKTHPQLPIL